MSQERLHFILADLRDRKHIELLKDQHGWILCDENKYPVVVYYDKPEDSGYVIRFWTEKEDAAKQHLYEPCYSGLVPLMADLKDLVKFRKVYEQKKKIKVEIQCFLCIPKDVLQNLSRKALPVCRR